MVRFELHQIYLLLELKKSIFTKYIHLNSKPMLSLSNKFVIFPDEYVSYQITMNRFEIIVNNMLKRAITKI